MWASMVRLRQLLDTIRHRLLFIPVLCVVVAAVISQLMLQTDQRLADERLPQILETTVDGGRSILTAIAGGLISSVTLLLSMMLVAVQLASSQFSPRTVRNWIGDRTQQFSIGFVLGTTIYCLLVLRETRSFDEGEALTPHLSVIVAMVLGIGSLIAVVRSVDHLTNRLRVGSVAAGIMKETVSIIETDERLRPIENPELVPAAALSTADEDITPPDDAHPVVAPAAGWVQQIDVDAVCAAIPEESTIYITVAVGSFTFPHAPVAWIWPAPPQPDDVDTAVIKAIALGDTRTMQQDIGFGITQMVDIALRALSPGVNDPNTANDLIVHLGVVLLALWERPIAATKERKNGRAVIRHDLAHGDYLHSAFDPIRLYGASDPNVAATAIRTLATLHAEVVRRGLPGRVEPIEQVIAQIIDAVNATDLSDYDKASVDRLSPPHLRRFTPEGHPSAMPSPSSNDPDTTS